MICLQQHCSKVVWIMMCQLLLLKTSSAGFGQVYTGTIIRSSTANSISSRPLPRSKTEMTHFHTLKPIPRESLSVVHLSKEDNKPRDELKQDQYPYNAVEEDEDSKVRHDVMPFLQEDDDDDDDDEQLSEDVIREKQEGAPSELEIMKELLGINAFTYVLAGLIAFFLGMNLLLGPGWLGQQMGLEGTGTFTQISDSLPNSVDLSKPEFLL